MSKFAVIALATFALVAPALADSRPSTQDAERVRAAIAAHGFTGGEIERDDDGPEAFEVDDARDQNGLKFDIKLDKDFRILKVERD